MKVSLPRRRAAPTSTERPVQRGAIRLLAMAGCEVVHVPNGSHLAGDQLARIKQVTALKADGMRTGFPDLIVIGKLPGQIGFMECKRAVGGVLRPDQAGWRDLLTDLGWPWALISQPEEAIAALRAWGWKS